MKKLPVFSNIFSTKKIQLTEKTPKNLTRKKKTNKGLTRLENMFAFINSKRNDVKNEYIDQKFSDWLDIYFKEKK